MLIIFGGGWVVVLFASISEQCFQIAFENTFLLWNIFSERANKMFFLETLLVVRNFSLLQSVQTGSTHQPATYSVVTDEYILGGEPVVMSGKAFASV